MSHVPVPSAAPSSSARLVIARSPKRLMSPAIASTSVEPLITKVRGVFFTQLAAATSVDALLAEGSRPALRSRRCGRPLIRWMPCAGLVMNVLVEHSL